MSRKGEYNREVLQLQQLLGRKLRLHAETEQQVQASAEREKVLCDLLLHQEFFEQFAAFVAEHVSPGAAGSAAAGSDSGMTLQDLLQAGAFTTGSTEPIWPHLQLPNSYLARLLRQASLQQVQQVLQMTPNDWVDFWADMVPQLLVLLEVCSRSKYDYDPVSRAAAASGSSSSSDEDAALPKASGVVPPALQRASQQQQWSLQQQPLHASAAANRELLWQVVDAKLQLNQLAWVLNPAPLFSVSDVCLSGGPQAPPGHQHWEAVADRLQLSPIQEVHFSICITELKRMQEALRADGVNLLHTAQQPSLQVAAALQQQEQDHQQQQQQEPLCHGAQRTRSRSRLQTAQAVQQAGAHEGVTAQQQGCAVQTPDATQATASWQRPLARQFQNLVGKRHLQLLCVNLFLVNTLTRHQVALLVVASFPFVPAIFTVAEIVCSRLQQRRQQQLRELERGASMKASAALRKAVLAGLRQPSAAAATVDDDDAGSVQGPKRVPYSQWLREQHDQERAAELLLHQHYCWSQLDRLQDLMSET